MIYREAELKVLEAIDGRAIFVLLDVDTTIGTQEQRIEINNIPRLTDGLRAGEKLRFIIAG